MDPATYDLTLRQAYMVAYFLVSLDGLPDAVRMADHGEALAPLIDPTLYMRKGKALGEDLRVMRALRECRDELIKAGVKPRGEVS